ncbi:hypothetical protein Q4Q39_13460 [Flavivirga amylovorans]|uniref:Uncharacterized protein n=1 Tax=Flavivirga amylovorans TaxID=870486 RepID=A0ABT8X391_9FLAO|nr:hypothetical protein [Flavivirga amylovorans]MDO5988414.1 hypothetical protein [Flavivirga amylovorans]
MAFLLLVLLENTKYRQTTFINKSNAPNQEGRIISLVNILRTNGMEVSNIVPRITNADFESVFLSTE